MSIASINGIDLYYVVHGSKSPVLFIHGYPLSGRLWDAVVEPLRDHYKLIIPDLRGMGRSGTSPLASMAQYADDLAALLKHIGEERPVVVVSLSMGGYVAFEFFRKYPQRVRAMVLADTRAEPDAPEKAKSREETALKVLTSGSQLVADDMGKVLFGAKASPQLRQEWQAIMTATPKEGVAAALRAMAHRPDSVPTLAQIRVPTLIIVGEEDKITPVDAHRIMNKGIANSQMDIISGAGHMTPVETPQVFVKTLRTFLDKLPENR